MILSEVNKSRQVKVTYFLSSVLVTFESSYICVLCGISTDVRKLVRRHVYHSYCYRMLCILAEEKWLSYLNVTSMSYKNALEIHAYYAIMADSNGSK